MGGCFTRVESVESPGSSAAKKDDAKRRRNDRISLTIDLGNSSPITPADLSSSLVGSNLQMFTIAEVRSMCQNRTSTNYLGEGGFGPVYKGFIDDKIKPGSGLKGQAVAVKSLDLEGTQGHKEWLTEVILLGQMRHPHLVRLIGYCYENEQRMLVYEYMAKGSLENHLFRRRHNTLPWNKRIKIAIGAAKGLAFLHQEDQQVIYRDVKSSNILLDSNYEAKLSDFGLAKDGPEGDDTHVSTRVMGTEGYAAPEYIMTGHLTPKSDVYSFGVVLLELLTGRRPFDDSRPPREQNLLDWAKSSLNDPRRLMKIMDPNLEGQYPTEAVKTTASLAYKCLSHLPKHRPNMCDIVEILQPLENLKDTFEFNAAVEKTACRKKEVTPRVKIPMGEKRPVIKLPANAHRKRSNSPKCASYSDTSLYKKSPRQQRPNK